LKSGWDVTMYYKDWTEWKAIVNFYGEKTAKRSKVPLINHIEEGLKILDKIRASDDAKRAFCLHPLFQANEDLTTAGMNFLKTYHTRPEVIVLVMEYRNQANAWLLDKVKLATVVNSDDKVVSSWIECTGKPTAGPMPEVRDMLIADKVQNRKDFLQYHAATHELTQELDMYFRLWLQELGISEEQYALLIA
jgi:hypothetical protein